MKHTSSAMMPLECLVVWKAWLTQTASRCPQAAAIAAALGNKKKKLPGHPRPFERHTAATTVAALAELLK